RLYPPLSSPSSRRRYKEDFALGLRRYKELCAQLDALGQQLAQLEQQLEQLPEDSAQYQSPEYQDKKRESQTLRNKLFHIKRMVSDYDKL
ncbi:OCLN protein, partial [Leucopsar rothschildi]|nr:OCLN protein [Leucopsar rothschildi]